MGVIESHRDVGAPLKTLEIRKIGRAGIGVSHRDGTKDAAGLGVISIHLHVGRDDGIEAGDGGAESERAADDAAQSGAGSSGSRAGASRAATGTRSEASGGSSRRILHHPERSSQKSCSGLGAEQVGIGNAHVVALDGDVHIVLQRQRDCVVHRQHEFAVLQHRLDAWGIAQIGRGNGMRLVGSDQIGKMRIRFGKVVDFKRLGRRGCLA